MAYKNVTDFQNDKKIKPLIEGHNTLEEKRIIEEIFAAFSVYALAREKRAEDDRQKKGLALDSFKQLRDDEQQEILLQHRIVLKKSEDAREELHAEFFDLFKDLLLENSPWEPKHYKELRTLKDSIEFATEVVSNKSTELTVFQGFDKKNEKLSERIQSIETTAKRELKWRGIGYGIMMFLGLTMIAAGLALSLTGVGLAPGLVLIAGGALVCFAEAADSTLYAADREVKMDRNRSQDSIRKSIGTMFQEDYPAGTAETGAAQKPQGKK